MRSSSPSWPELLASFDQLTEDDIAIASDRAPSFDLGALASVAGLRDSRGQIPLDFVVPIRTALAPADGTDGLDASVMFVLLRVDGKASLREISEATKLSLPRTIEIFFELHALGLVEVVEIPGNRPTA
jgi:hypothetical protein